MRKTAWRIGMKMYLFGQKKYDFYMIMTIKQSRYLFWSREVWFYLFWSKEVWFIYDHYDQTEQIFVEGANVEKEVVLGKFWADSVLRIHKWLSQMISFRYFQIFLWYDLIVCYIPLHRVLYRFKIHCRCEGELWGRARARHPCCRMTAC